MEHHPLLHPLLPTTTTTTTTTTLEKSVDDIKTENSGIIFRFTFILFVGTIAIWANHEASKGFSITIVNDAGNYSPAGKRFSIFYESNDKATRIVLNTSKFVENLLYPDDHLQAFQHKKKQINGVTLRLAATNCSSKVIVHSQKNHEFVIVLSPSLMENPDSSAAVVSAVQRGMARVWLWDGKGATPRMLLNGMVEYINNLAGFPSSEVVQSGGGDVAELPEKYRICWKDEDPRRVAEFLRFCDGGGQPGGGDGAVVRRLNQEMKDGWDDGMMDDALGMTTKQACASFSMTGRHDHSSNSM